MNFQGESAGVALSTMKRLSNGKVWAAGKKEPSLQAPRVRLGALFGSNTSVQSANQHGRDLLRAREADGDGLASAASDWICRGRGGGRANGRRPRGGHGQMCAVI